MHHRRFQNLGPAPWRLDGGLTSQPVASGASSLLEPSALGGGASPGRGGWDLERLLSKENLRRAWPAEESRVVKRAVRDGPADDGGGGSSAAMSRSVYEFYRAVLATESGTLLVKQRTGGAH